MSPPGHEDSGKIRRGSLALVEPVVEPAAPATPSVPPAEEVPLPPRRVAPEALRRLTQGRLAPKYFETLSAYLAELTLTHPQNGLDVTLRSDRLQYRFLQEAPNSPIEVKAAQLRGGDFSEVLRMTYRPDGRVLSSLHPEPHSDWLRGPEKSHHGILQGMLSRHAESLLWGSDLYRRLSESLQGLEGRYEPESHSLWYEHFAVDRGGIFSFALQNAPGRAEAAWKDYFPQLRVFADSTATGAERRLLFNLSPNGEINFDPNRPLREVLDPAHQQLLGRLSSSLASASENPQAYEIALSRALQRIPGGLGIPVPRIGPATRIKATAGTSFGEMGEPILEIQFLSDLARNFHPLASHRWQNPENSADVRVLRPSLRLSGAMGIELLRRVLGGPYHLLYNAAVSEPRPRGDSLRLRLFPKGGGELTVYRRGELHDIVSQTHDGRTWRASDAIQDMELKGENFETRFQALQAAVSQRNSASSSGSSLRVQQAPTLDLERFHLRADGTAEPVRNTDTAWRLIQRQIPPGVEVRELNDLNLRGNVSEVQVDFFASQPSMRLKIRQTNVPGPDGRSIPRVSLFLESGTEHRRSAVFEDGVYRKDLSVEALQRTLEAERSPAGRSWLRAAASAGHFYVVRRLAWGLTGGLPYAVGHFGSGYAVRRYERWLYSPAELRILGSPEPQYNMNYFRNNIVGPYLKMALFSGLGSVIFDGVYNSMFSRAMRARQLASVGAMSFSQAWRNTSGSFFNPNPIARPMRTSLSLRVLQRGIPLIAGLAGPELLDHHRIDPGQFLRNLKYVGAASVASTALTSVMTRPRSMLTRSAVRAGLVRSAGIGVRGARLATTLRGSVVLALLEFTIMGIWSAHDRREAMGEVRTGLRSQLGNSIDRKNELLTRIQRGEEVPPRELIEADQNFQQSLAAYRRFLEMDERTTGSGSYAAIGLENDFSAEFDAFDRQSALAAGAGTGMSFGLEAFRSGHETRLGTLRERRTRMDSELRALYARYGARDAAAPELSLREWVRHLAAAGESSEASAIPPPRSSPIAVDSPEAQAILEQFRWKAAREPSFVLWSPDRRARYLLHQFSGYQVHESNGAYRPWDLQDALAFLGEVDRAESRRAANFEEPLSLPREREGFNTDSLQRLFTEERAIREREMASHTHSAAHASSLADNAADLDRQMNAYLELSNRLTTDALERYLEPAPVVAMNP